MGITQAYISIGYWVDDTRQSDYFTLDEMERAREAFPDQIAYIDSSAYTSADAEYKRTKSKFEYKGIDYNYQDVQPVNVVYGRYLNEGDILGKKEERGHGHGERQDAVWGGECGGAVLQDHLIWQHRRLHGGGNVPQGGKRLPGPDDGQQR